MKKKILGLFLILLVGFATWFGTSYALKGVTYGWFNEDEPQIEEELPDEEPGDSTGDNTETPGDNSGDNT